MNILFLGAFGLTFFQPPVMIYRFAVLQDKSIPYSPGKKKIAAYCKKVTIVWIAFFIINGSMAAWTIFSGSDAFWSIYNGGISYVLMGILFAGEFLIRKRVQKNIPRVIPLTALDKKSRPLSAVLCYEDAWSGGGYKTWKDFLEGTAKLRRYIETINSERWLLYCDDYWFFLLAFTGLLQCKKEILLSANLSPAYIAEIRNTENSEDAPFLTDHVFADEDKVKNTYLVQNILAAGPEIEAGIRYKCPVINGSETSVIMFTSGSTGKPKPIKQRLTEFENDNRFILSKWGEQFLNRKLCSTVNQHHIYGLLFSILLPFTAGVPFKRTRIQIPEEMEKLSDTEYMIITVPAFLKRAVEIETPAALQLVSPWIFTSGGALDRETARKTAELFGFWPLEVYGSTETSGIAWRQSDKGPEWTIFDNAQIASTQEGCLIIRSPYIKDPAGFETADMVEILEDGRFLLKGRIDSVVKIEEKRISLTEIENRILQSGLAANVCVIPCKDKRQYLAAAVALNDKGKEQFSGLEKHAINTFWRKYLLQYFESLVIPKKWRYPPALPMDDQGKIKREDIAILFTEKKPRIEGIKIIEQTEDSVVLEFTIPAGSPYFSGHFPEFSILPAVAQIELIVRFASSYLGTDIAAKEIRRVKFINFIRPGAHLAVRLQKSEKGVAFKIHSPDNKTAYSSGTVIISPAAEGNK